MSDRNRGIFYTIRGLGNAIIALNCLHYLSYFNNRDCEDLTLLQIFAARPAADYSARHWWDYVREAEKNKQDDRVRPLALQAIKDIKTLKYMMRLGIGLSNVLTIDILLINPSLPLLLCTHMELVGITMDLLENSFDVSAIVPLPHRGTTWPLHIHYCPNPLHAACHRGNFDLAKLLIDHGADISQRGYIYSSALCAAAAGGSPKVIELLLEHNAEIEAHIEGDTSEKDRWYIYTITPLQVAVQNTNAEAAALLIKKGASCTDTLRYAPRFQPHRLEMVQLLVENGAKVDRRDSHGETTLHLVSRRNEPEINTYLLDRRADIEARNNGG